MPSANPYEAPKAAVESATAFQRVRLLSVSGRMGRALHVVWSVGLGLGFAMIPILFSDLGVLMPEGIVLFAFVAMLTKTVLLAFLVMLTIQRCHDLGASGWTATLLLIPLLNLVFWFLPGTPGPNRFGAPPPPNSVAVIVLLWLFSIAFALVAVAVVGIVAMGSAPR